MVILNDEYAKRYNGKLILRFDDTDPKNPNKIPLKEAYEMIRNDLKWLGVEWHEEIIASQRLKLYYEYFKKCIEKGLAYVCTCDAEEWRRKVRGERIPCACRSKSIEENLTDWQRMLSGEFKEGEAVGRIKTDINAEDPAVIDWVAFRIVDNPVHPLFETPPKVWPSLDFASAIDDKLTGVTHIIRGKDLMISEKRQRYLYDAMGWEYPKVFVFGKIFSEELVFSTRKMREGIEKGLYKGFDDPKLPTLIAFRKRGIHPQAIRNYIISLGLNESETCFDPNILYAENRKILDPIAKRFFLVKEPVEIELEELPSTLVKAPLYPRKEAYREIPMEKRIFIEKEDFEKYRGKEIRLMHFCNIILDKKAKVTSVENKDIPKIHWVSKPVKIRVIFPEKEIEALGEENLLQVEKDEYVQFERVGFARCESKGLFYFAHK
jgi:glutamyl-tRNA synthetase